ncbi:MAG: serine/threonine-protein kinase, partial [Acidimicrobiales bacterium]|nr:serine/threonine-protein kinase [Acidimicrobiales bacterium]
MISPMEQSAMTMGDRYELVEVVGRGGMGEVWSARDLRLGRSVAVKLLSPHMASEAGVRERFEAEARSAARLSHPNVVQVFDSGEHDGIPYLVMELLPGRTLADEVALGRLDPEAVRRIGMEVLGALEASHQAGILHRDIKPGNVLLAADGRAKVGDFGIAKSTEGLNLTSTGMIVGTAAYLAPERVAGEPATPQSDLYAVGVVLYEALSGRKPFEADTPIGLMRAVEAHQAIPLAEARPGLEASLVAAVERAMAKDPGRRFNSAAAMAAALGGDNVAAGGGTATVLNAVPSSTEVLSAPTARRP